MKRKFVIGLFLILVLIANASLASYSTVTMSVVEEPVCTIELTENSKFEKRLISKDLTNKEVTIQLQVTNEEEAFKPTGELILVIDNSKSMTDSVNETQTRKDLVFSSAQTLVSTLLTNNSQLQIGVVSFSTSSDISKEGTIDDASVASPLTNDITSLQNAISNIPTTGDRTDLDSGLTLGSQQFSDSQNNKYLVVLTDGVPNVALDDRDYFADSVIEKTKQKLQSIGTQGINVITMLTGIDDETYNSEAKPSTKTYGEIITQTFGTSTNPTVGKFYYVTDSEIEKTINTDIYNDLLPIDKVLKDIEIVDYFPQEIIDNFDFSYVSDPNFGDISAVVDQTNNSITWTIPELATNETATVQYKLKLKEDFDSNIVDKLLDTNEKVDISYTDFDGNEQEDSSDVTPVLKLTEPPVVLPKAGNTVLIGFVVLAGILVVFSLTRLLVIKNKMKF